jgi:FkbM family methyltransferase
MTVAKESEANVADRHVGQIVRAFISGREVYFFIINPEDSISKFHNAGVFYEQEELDIIARHFRGGVFVDIGAHFGNHALYVSKFLDPSRIIVFEANPLAIDVMRIHFSLNRRTDIDTRFLGIALAASEGRLKAVSPDPNNIGHTMFSPAPDASVLALLLRPVRRAGVADHPASDMIGDGAETALEIRHLVLDDHVQAQQLAIRHITVWKKKRPWVLDARYYHDFLRKD